jgi:predicted nucleotidyltransferase
MGFLEFVKNNENSRKIFGKKELEIIEKQLNGVELTQSEKNRLSRDIRKKLDFIREASYFSKEFYLKKGSEINSNIDEFLKIIKSDRNFIDIKKIFLFGSSNLKDSNLLSDIDLAVSLPDLSKKESLSFKARILGRAPEKIDLSIFELLPDNIQKDILKNSRIIYNSDE